MGSTLLENLSDFIGLDPAGPFFENTDPAVRLDPTDALFVDVIHTDGAHNLLLGFGIYFHLNILELCILYNFIFSGTLQRMGHVDFYPNGGYDQPNCPKTSGKVINLILQLGILNVEGKSYRLMQTCISASFFYSLGFMITSLCSHMAAVHFYTDTVRNQCPYMGYSCTNFDDFNSGKCTLQCDSNGHQCNRMGYWASSNNGKGELYLKTQDASAFPYCSKFSCIFYYYMSTKTYFFCYSSKSLPDYTSVWLRIFTNTRYSNYYTDW
jgi:hypothetical protein